MRSTWLAVCALAMMPLAMNAQRVFSEPYHWIDTLGEASPLHTTFNATPSQFIVVDTSNVPDSGLSFSLDIVPVVDVAGWVALNDEDDENSGYVTVAGLKGVLDLGDKFSAGFRWAAGRAGFQDYLRTIADSTGNVPALGRAYGSGFQKRFSQTDFFVGYQPFYFLNLEIGRGKQFIGDGYRSLFLSDFAPNYVYGKLDAQIWKMRYTVLYTNMNNASNYPISFAPATNKYSTMHYLSVNLTRHWQVGFFEAVVWAQEDSIVTRAFDVNYLNPVIFLRPVEYSIGSTDNSLIGFSSSVGVGKSWKFYAQVILDELLFAEFTAKARNALFGTNLPTGWWANKQGFQLGAKALEPFGIKGFSALAEFNLVRPFTYGHGNRASSFTHSNAPLAHPLGSNFLEWIFIADYQKGKWRHTLRTAYSRKGYSSTTFLGEDPVISNNERDINNASHGNELLQGEIRSIANLQWQSAFVFSQANDLQLYGGVQLRNVDVKTQRSTGVFLSLGVRANMWNTYTDY